MAGVQAGRLSIEIVAEIARLQQGLDQAKRAVKSMSNDIARDTRAANDNIARLGTGFTNTARNVGASANGTRAAMQQLSFQLGDIAQGFAMGTRPMTIFAQQSGQVIQALSLMTNSTKGFLGFMAGPWGLVISAAAVVLVPLIAKLLEAEDAVKKVEFASYKLGDAQGILGSVMDMTTGKINTQKDALLALAQAQILAGQIQARADQANARKALGGIAATGFNITGNMVGGLRVNTGVQRTEAGIIEAFTEGSMNTQEAVAGLDSLRKTGMITEQAFLDAAKAVTDFGVAAENLRVFEGAERMLDGQGTASDRGMFLDPAKAAKGRKGRQGPTAEDIARRFDDQLLSITLQSLAAMGQLATSAEERAELEMRALEWNHRQLTATIAADEHFNAAQKAELTFAAERLAERQREVVQLRERQQLEQEAQQVADAQRRAALEGLAATADLAGTEAERKDLALQIFDADMAYLRAKLEAVKNSEAVGDIERQIAQIQLDALNATAAQRRAGVSQANETRVERYMRDLNMTSGQINEALDGIKIDGLDALNEGLLDAITGVKSLGEVFHDVAQQILADLMQLFIRQTIMRALGSVLFGGSGGSDPSGYYGGIESIGGLFGGGRANGGPVSPGEYYAVNERSTAPGLFFPLAPGVIQPPTASASGGSNDNAAPPLSVVFNNDFRGAAPEAVAQIESRLDRMERELPGKVVSIYQDARSRFVIRN